MRYLLNLVELACRVLPIAIRNRPAVVHCHDTLMLPLGAMVSLVVGSALVYDAHELESRKAGQSKLLSWGTELIERLCWSRIALFISVSPAIVDWYNQHFGMRRSIVVLNTPIVSQHLSEGGNRPMLSAAGQRYFHRLYGLEARTVVFIYVGLLVPGRGIERLLEVFSRSRIKFHVIFVGYGDQVGVSDWACRHANIHLHPAVSHERLVPLISEADCGLCLIEDVSLSDRLCLPNKLFEYAFAGVPVLASRLPEINRVVGEYGLGICCDSDTDSIEAAVRKVEREGIQAPKRELTELSWGAQAARLKSAYRTLLSERKPVTPNSKGAT
jgi:glycosyltransferase involved in cell wall biosynthesis